MGIKGRDGVAHIKAYLAQEIQRIEEALVNSMGYIGEQANNAARTVPEETGFKDDTGNLRSSIGFTLVREGQVIQQSDFKKVKETATKGPQKGRDFAKQVAAWASKPITLVLVAGMDYASAVSQRGRDVLDSGAAVAKKGVEGLKKKFEI